METKHTCTGGYRIGELDTACPACVHDHAISLVEEGEFGSVAEAARAIHATSATVRADADNLSARRYVAECVEAAKVIGRDITIYADPNEPGLAWERWEDDYCQSGPIGAGCKEADLIARAFDELEAAGFQVAR